MSTEPPIDTSRAAVEANPDLRMDAYYYGFDRTQVACIDKILSAVACAGKAFHHTNDWTEECSPFGGCVGETPVEWIQNAANEAARLLRALADERDQARATALEEAAKIADKQADEDRLSGEEVTLRTMAVLTAKQIAKSIRAAASQPEQSRATQSPGESQP